MATVSVSEQSLMQRIWEALPKCKPEPGENKELASDILELFREYADDYAEEWRRLDDNAAMYRGDHWAGITDSYERNPNAPKPSVPILTSTVESICADLSDDFPTAVIEPDIEMPGLDIMSKALTRVLWQELDASGWPVEYDTFTREVVPDGWGVLEVGYDPDMNDYGGMFIRNVPNKNWMCDAQCPDFQYGRAVFEFDRKPRDWFWQRYPDFAPFIESDNDLVSDSHDTSDGNLSPKRKQYVRLIGAWFRVYDTNAKRYRIHLVLIAGGQILYNSATDKPDGYYVHGRYPFVIGRSFRNKSDALGFGIIDLFKEENRNIDKMQQIVLINAYRASRPRLLYQAAMVDPKEITDFSNEAISVTGAPKDVAMWQETQPLPSHIFVYIESAKAMIKQESGTNDQSRGQTGAGVTAASAIDLLQDMSTKRSRMLGRMIHAAFQDAIRMMIETMRGCDLKPRDIGITFDGKKQTVPFSSEILKTWFDKGVPIERYVTIRTARQTKYSIKQHNDLWVEMMKTFASMGVPIDPASMMEGLLMDGNEKEMLSDNLSRAMKDGVVALQRQVAALTEQLKAEQETNGRYRNALSQADALLQGGQQQQGGVPTTAGQQPQPQQPTAR